MKIPPLKNPTVDYCLSALCFAIPIGSLLGGAIIQDGVGMLGLGLCFLASLFVFGALFFKLPHHIKDALASYLVGFVLAMGFFVWGAYISLSEAHSPWLS